MRPHHSGSIVTASCRKVNECSGYYERFGNTDSIRAEEI